jgi:hypothetical protein
MAAWADHGESAFCRDPRTGRGVEHPLAGLKVGRPEEERQEVRRDMSDGPVVCRCRLVLEWQFAHRTAPLIDSHRSWV